MKSRQYLQTDQSNPSSQKAEVWIYWLGKQMQLPQSPYTHLFHIELPSTPPGTFSNIEPKESPGLVLDKVLWMYC